MSAIKRLVNRFGLPEEAAEKLVQAGYVTPRRIRAAADKELLDVEGIGPAMLKKIRKVFPYTGG